MSSADINDESDKAGQRRSRRRRGLWILSGLLIVVAALLVRPAWHLLTVARSDLDEREPLPTGFVDDASRMNRTGVYEVWPIPEARDEVESQLAELLQRARKEKLRVSIAGARHSMGGHTIYPGGIAIDMMSFDHIKLDAEQNILHVGSGATWKEIIAYLDPLGRSVAVMQSNNSFSVGGSISVNCHGWQFGKPPIASTVERFRLMQADGSVVSCSRKENAELFSLVLGGYGLCGVILDVDLRVIPNERYRLEQFVVPLEEALTTFEASVLSKPDVAMVYARMGIVPDDFLNEVIINVLYRDPADDGSLPPLSAAGMVKLRRSLFRGSVGSNYGKELRWEAETKLQPHLRQQHFSRNQLLNEGVEVFQNWTADSTDILHEYFVPRAGAGLFVDKLRDIIPAHDVDLLNVTVRSVDVDDDTFLRYADRPMFAFVMLFNQQRTDAAEAEMEKMTQELIDAALVVGGRYYLPYRLHATVEQFHQAYPQAARFFDFKRQYDPEEIFQNRFYLKYAAE